MYVNPVPLPAEEQEFARLMSEPPMSYSEAVAFRAAAEAPEDE